MAKAGEARSRSCGPRNGTGEGRGLYTECRSRISGPSVDPPVFVMGAIFVAFRRCRRLLCAGMNDWIIISCRFWSSLVFIIECESFVLHS